MGGATGLGGTTGAGDSAAGAGGSTSALSSTTGTGGTTKLTGGTTGPSGGTTGLGGTTGPSGGTTGLGGTTGPSGGTTGLGGSGGTVSSGGSSVSGGTAGTSTKSGSAGASGSGGVVATAGSSGTGGSGGRGGSSTATGGAGGTTSSGGSTGPTGSGPVGVLSGPLDTGIIFTDTDGKPVNAHGGGIIQVGDTFYLHGEYFVYDASVKKDVYNNFHGFSMYSSKDLATWKNEGLILSPQSGTELASDRKGERPHILKCPASGEFVLYAHAASQDYQTDKEVVYATSPTVNGKYSFKGALKNAAGTKAEHSDMGAFADGNDAYVVTESGHIYKLATDCHSWLSDNSYGAMGGMESPAVFKANGTYYWIMSNKTGWRANNNEYASAPSMTGPWTNQGYIAPVTDPSNNLSDQRTWLTQSTWVQPVVGSKGTVYVYWGDHWYHSQDTSGATSGDRNDQAGYVFQPIVFNGTKISLPTYLTTWKIDIGAGTWSQ